MFILKIIYINYSFSWTWELWSCPPIRLALWCHVKPLLWCMSVLEVQVKFKVPLIYHSHGIINYVVLQIDRFDIICKGSICRKCLLCMYMCVLKWGDGEGGGGEGRRETIVVSMHILRPCHPFFDHPNNVIHITAINQHLTKKTIVYKFISILNYHA